MSHFSHHYTHGYDPAEYDQVTDLPVFERIPRLGKSVAPKSLRHGASGTPQLRVPEIVVPRRRLSLEDALALKEIAAEVISRLNSHDRARVKPTGNLGTSLATTVESRTIFKRHYATNGPSDARRYNRLARRNIRAINGSTGYGHPVEAAIGAISIFGGRFGGGDRTNTNRLHFIAAMVVDKPGHTKVSNERQRYLSAMIPADDPFFAEKLNKDDDAHISVLKTFSVAAAINAACLLRDYDITGAGISLQPIHPEMSTLFKEDHR